MGCLVGTGTFKMPPKIPVKGAKRCLTSFFPEGYLYLGLYWEGGLGGGTKILGSTCAERTKKGELLQLHQSGK